jgi:cellulose synthase/poly-beta-1,6-N-acetylglucosamine synthase-like glycosyltransferase
MSLSIVSITAAVFWMSVFEILYSYMLYPVLLRTLSRRFGRPTAASDSYTPSVAIVMPVYNEEKIIEKKIRNIFDLKYPAAKLSVWIGSDCSTDRTEEIVRSFRDPRIHIWVAPRRIGKALVLNTLLPQVEAEVVVLTDADVMLDPESVGALSRHYADPEVGGVGGSVVFLWSNGVERTEETAYLSFEAAQKKMESALHSTISAFGSFYSIRKRLFVPFHQHTYSNDDVMMPMNIIRQGYRMYFEPAAISYEEARPEMKMEFRRRIRIGAGNFQAFFWLLDFLNPKYGWPWFCYSSHKVSRWFSPLFLCIATLSCGLLAFDAAGPHYKLLFIAGVLFVASGLLYKFIPLNFPRKAFYFLAMNTALVLGFMRFLGGIRSAVWSRTERSA